MIVKKLVGEEFDAACRQLAENCLAYAPDIVIGVKTGGAIILDVMMNANVFDANTLRDDIKIQRVSTEGLKGLAIVKTIISLLPGFLIVLLRKYEMWQSELKAGYKTPERTATIALKKETLDLIKKGDAKILIIDDAIDTGATMEIAISYLKELNEKSNIKVASLTVTHKNPKVVPDYSLFNRTILQFPWSLDT